MGRVPSSAFDEYVAAGDERSYQLMATRYGVSKRAIGKRASREHWQERLATIEQQVRERADARLVESLEEMNARHLKMVKVMELKALEALKSMPIHSAAVAARTLDAAIGRERAIRGAPDTLRGAAIQNNVQQVSLSDLICAANQLDESVPGQALEMPREVPALPPSRS